MPTQERLAAHQNQYDRYQVTVATMAFLPTQLKIMLTSLLNVVIILYARLTGGLGGKAKLEELARKSRAQEVQGVERVAIVTGGNTGIGYHTAKALGLAGYRVIVACRSEERGLEAVKTLVEETGSSKIEYAHLDLASFASVRAFATKFLGRGLPLHLLVNNAGVMMCPFELTEDGYEMQVGVNHLGHFLLTHLLLNILKASAPARIITVASNAQYGARTIKFEHISDNINYDPIRNYAESKMANVQFTLALERRLAGSGVHAYTLDPGPIATELYRHNKAIAIAVSIAKGTVFLTPAEGAVTSVYIALTPGLEVLGGGYFFNCHEAHPNPFAISHHEQDRLWDASVKWTGVQET